MERQGQPLGDEPALLVAQRRRHVHRRLDVGRVGRAHQRDRHLVDDRVEGVLDELEADRVDRCGSGRLGHAAAVVAMTMSPCSSSRAAARGGTRVVASYSSTRSGPDRGRQVQVAAPDDRHGQQADIPPEPCLAIGLLFRGRRRHPTGPSRVAAPDTRGQAQVHERDRVGQRSVAVGPLVLAARRPRRGRRAGKRSPDPPAGRWSARTTGPCSADRRSGSSRAGRPGSPRPGWSTPPPPSGRTAPSMASSVRCIQRAHERPDEVVLEVRLEQADRAEDARRRRDDDRRDPEPDRHLGGVQRARCRRTR